MRQGRDQVDEIAHGDGGPSLTERLPAGWRRLLASAVALCVGLVLGGYGVRAWPEDARHDPELRASLYPLTVSGSYMTLRLANLGSRPLTVDRLRLRLRAFDVVWNGLADPRAIPPEGTVDVSLELAADCRSAPREAVTAEVRVRGPGEEPRWVDVRIPLPPADAAGSLTNSHDMMCRGRFPFMELETLSVRSSADVLELRVRMALSAGRGREAPEGVRLRGFRSRFGGLRMSFAALRGSDAVALPVVGELRIRVTDCESLPDSPLPLLAFQTELTSERSAADAVPVVPDIEFARAVFDHVAARC